VLSRTLDAQLENPSGLGLYGAFFGRFIESRPGASRYEWGVMAQASQMLDPKHLELFGQGQYIRFRRESLPGGAELDVWAVTGGMNYYFQGHSAKLTLDFSWFPGGAPLGADSLGILADPSNNEFLLRLQFELLI